MEDKEMIIDVKQVSKEYKIDRSKKILALNNVSYSIDCGEIVGLIGLNGAGKSTTIKLLTGIIKPSNGEIEIMGKNPFKNRKEICTKYGVMFGQRSQLWWDLPVRDSFYVNSCLYNISKKNVAKKLIFYKEWLKIDYLNTPVRKLSLGQRTTCDILLSMLHDPEILFLDEATIALDVFSRKRILEIISKINKELGTTIIITSHQLDDIEKVCQRIIMLNKGEICYDGKLKNFLQESDFTKIICINAINEERLKKEIQKFEFGKYLPIQSRGSVVNIFLKQESDLVSIMKFLSTSENIEDFSIRGITLEERILLMEG